MSSSHDLTHVLVALLNEWTLCLPVKLTIYSKIIETTAVVDCGATRNFINLGLLTQANFPLQWLPWLILAYNMNGITNTKGAIWWETSIELQFYTPEKPSTLWF